MQLSEVASLGTIISTFLALIGVLATIVVPIVIYRKQNNEQGTGRYEPTNPPPTTNPTPTPEEVRFLNSIGDRGRQDLVTGCVHVFGALVLYLGLCKLVGQSFPMPHSIMLLALALWGCFNIYRGLTR